MEEKREPLSEMAIERKIQILRNKHMDSEVIALVKSDYEYGLTDDEIGLYLNKSYDIEQMKVLSKCLHKGVSEELLTLLKDSRMAALKMQTALDYYEKGVPIDAIREVVQKDDTAVNMRRMFDVVLEKLNKAKEQMPQDLEYVKSLVAQMDAYARIREPEKEETQKRDRIQEMPEFSVTVTPYEREGSNIKGLARIYFENSFIVNNINIVQGKEKIFVSMPSYKTKQVDEQGKPIYQDVCYPVTKDFREKLYNEIISEYEKAKDKSNEKARESAEKHHGNPDKEKDKEATPFR